MCTIIRVKRKINQDPAECLIVENKKKRVDGDTGGGSENEDGHEFKQILKYAGSARDEKEIPAKMILELSCGKLESKNDDERLVDTTNNSKTAATNRTNKLVGKSTAQSYVVVNKKRGLDEDERRMEDDDEVMMMVDKKAKAGPQAELENVNIIDVIISSEYFASQQEDNDQDKKKSSGETTTTTTKEKILCNGVEMIREKTQKSSSDDQSCYIYDLYYVKSDSLLSSGHLDLLYPNSYEIRAYSYYKDAELINDQEPEEPEAYEDEEDSNDEGNWKNDYPDEDEYDIDDEEDYEPGNMMSRQQRARHHNNPDDEEYDEYSYGYDEDDESGAHLATYMKKSLKLDRTERDDEEDLDDEYSTEEVNAQDDLAKAYMKYKRRVLRGLREQQDSDDSD